MCRWILGSQEGVGTYRGDGSTTPMGGFPCMGIGCGVVIGSGLGVVGVLSRGGTSTGVFVLWGNAGVVLNPRSAWAARFPPTQAGLSLGPWPGVAALP